MADLLPSTSDASAAEDAEPRVVGVDSEDADDVLAALSSATARQLLAALHDDPATPSELADAVDTSLQNTQYHLGNLEDAEVVEVVDTVYSEKGREMKVYAPADQPLVLFAGQEEETSTLKSALSRLLGGVGIVGAASVALHRLAGEMSVAPPSSGGGAESRGGGAVGGDADGGDGFTGDDAGAGGDADQTDGGTEQTTADDGDGGDVGVMEEEATETAQPTEYAAEETQTVVETARETTAEAADAADGTTTMAGDAAEAANDTATSVLDLSAGLSPGVLLFIAGTIVVTAWVFFYYVDR